MRLWKVKALPNCAAQSIVMSLNFIPIQWEVIKGFWQESNLRASLAAVWGVDFRVTG